MMLAALALLVSCADYDSGGIGVTNHEGFQLELEHNLKCRPSQTFVVFSPNLEDSYALWDTKVSYDSVRAVGVKTGERLVALWADAGEALQRAWGADEGGRKEPELRFYSSAGGEVRAEGERMTFGAQD